MVAKTDAISFVEFSRSFIHLFINFIHDFSFIHSFPRLGVFIQQHNHCNGSVFEVGSVMMSGNIRLSVWYAAAAILRQSYHKALSIPSFIPVFKCNVSGQRLALHGAAFSRGDGSLPGRGGTEQGRISAVPMLRLRQR